MTALNYLYVIKDVYSNKLLYLAENGHYAWNEFPKCTTTFSSKESAEKTIIKYGLHSCTIVEVLSGV